MKIPNENKYDELFQKYASTYNFDWFFLKAQVKQESLFNPKAKSSVNAKGLAQFMPATWGEWGHGGDIYNPEDSIRAQAGYMNWLRSKVQNKLFAKEDWRNWTLASYNWGLGHIIGYHRGDGAYIKGLLEKTQNWIEAESLLPQETKIYVQKINAYYYQYHQKEIEAIKHEPPDEIK